MTKVMLVDDDASMQAAHRADRAPRRLRLLLRGQRRADGLEMLRAERPDFLILDVMLPDTNGFEICEIIRGEGRKVPIMFLTAKGDIVDKSIGFKAGADDYLVKPFQPEELLAAPAARTCAGEKRERERRGRGGRRTDVIGAARTRWATWRCCFGKYEVRLRGEVGGSCPRASSSCWSCSASDPGAVFTRDQILEHAVGSKAAADPSSHHGRACARSARR